MDINWMEINKLFSFNVRYLAQKKDLKIGDIEHAMGVSTGYISRLSYGTGNVSLENAYTVSRILNVSLDDLCTDIRFKELEKTAGELGYRLVKIEPEPDDIKPDE